MNLDVIDRIRNSPLTAHLTEGLNTIPATLSRMALGWGFYWTGSGKMKNIEPVIEFFRGLHIPYPEYQAPFVARLEYYGAWLLMLGLFTRPVAFLLACTMIVALMTADRTDFLDTWNSASEKMPVETVAFSYLMLLLWLAVRGGGWLSVDAILGYIYGKLRGSRVEPAGD